MLTIPSAEEQAHGEHETALAARDETQGLEVASG